MSSSDRNAKGHQRSRPSVRSRTSAAPSQRTRAADPARLVACEVLRAVSGEDAYANLVADVKAKFNVELTRIAAFGVSAMMHG